MKKVSNLDVIKRFVAKTFVNIRDKLDFYFQSQVRFAKSKQSELEPLYELYYQILSQKYDMAKTFNYENFDFAEFETDLQQVEDFMKEFFENTFKDSALKDKLVANIKTFQYQFGDKEKSERNGAVLLLNKGFFRGEYNIQKEIIIGHSPKNKDNNDNVSFNSDMLYLECFAHELGHSVSQFCDLDYVLENGPRVKTYDICEIESLFMERLFDNYVLVNLDKISKNYNLGMNAKQLKNEILKNNDVRMFSMLNSIDSILEINYIDKEEPSKQYNYRYIVSEVCAHLLFEEYKKDPSQALQKYETLLSCSAQIEVSQVVRLLTDGKLENYEQALNAYMKLLSKNTNQQQYQPNM